MVVVAPTHKSAPAKMICWLPIWCAAQRAQRHRTAFCDAPYCRSPTDHVRANVIEIGRQSAGVGRARPSS